MSTQRFHWLNALPERPRRQEVVAGLIARGELVALAGSPGCGKSAVAAALAASVSTGQPFLGRQCVSGPVVYMALEKAGLTIRRLLATADPAAPILISGDRFLLSEHDGTAALIRDIRGAARHPALIIIDTLARAMLGLDENSSRDTGLAMDRLQEIGEAFPSAAIVLLHHLAQGNGSLRGSSAMLGAVDLELLIAGKNSVRTITIRKSNATEEGAVLNFRLSPIEVEDGTVIAAAPVDQETSGQARSKRALTPAAMSLLNLIPTGTSPRSDILSVARNEALLGENQGKQGERLRQLLSALKNADLIEFDASTVSKPSPQQTQRTPNDAPNIGGYDPQQNTPNEDPPYNGGHWGVEGENPAPIGELPALGAQIASEGRLQ